MPERIYEDSTRLIHFSIEFLSNGGSSGFLLETWSPDSAVDSVDKASPSAMTSLLLSWRRGEAGRCMLIGGSEVVSGDGKNVVVSVDGSVGVVAGDVWGDRTILASLPYGK